MLEQQQRRPCPGAEPFCSGRFSSAHSAWSPAVTADLREAGGEVLWSGCDASRAASLGGLHRECVPRAKLQTHTRLDGKSSRSRKGPGAGCWPRDRQ